MNDNYRRALYTLLHILERDLLMQRRAFVAPVHGAVYDERIDGEVGVALSQIDHALEVIRSIATRFGFEKRAVELTWQTRAQLLSDEISIQDMDPDGGGRGWGPFDDPGEKLRISQTLNALSASLAAIGDELAGNARQPARRLTR
jgi:hypothetical protein